jgi:hypothetical protein
MRPLGASTSIICLMTTFAEAKHCIKLGKMLRIRGHSSTDLVKEDIVTRLHASLEGVLESKRVHNKT